MKTKLTLSISERRIRRIKAYSARHRTSVSQLVEDFIDSLDKVAKHAGHDSKKGHAIDRLAGMRTGKVTAADLDADPRLAHIYRKGL